MYAAVSDMTARFDEAELVQVTDQAGAGVIDEAVVTAAIEDATNEIDSYVGKAYDLPLATTPPVLTRYCCDIARYELFKRKGEMAQVIQDAYNAAIRWLKSLSDGSTVLDLGGGVEAAPAEDLIMIDASLIAGGRQSLRGL